MIVFLLYSSTKQSYNPFWLIFAWADIYFFQGRPLLQMQFDVTFVPTLMGQRFISIYGASSYYNRVLCAEFDRWRGGRAALHWRDQRLPHHVAQPPHNALRPCCLQVRQLGLPTIADFTHSFDNGVREEIDTVATQAVRGRNAVLCSYLVRLRLLRTLAKLNLLTIQDS